MIMEPCGEHATVASERDDHGGATTPSLTLCEVKCQIYAPTGEVYSVGCHIRRFDNPNTFYSSWCIASGQSGEYSRIVDQQAVAHMQS